MFKTDNIVGGRLQRQLQFIALQHQGQRRRAMHMGTQLSHVIMIMVVLMLVVMIVFMIMIVIMLFSLGRFVVLMCRVRLNQRSRAQQ